MSTDEFSENVTRAIRLLGAVGGEARMADDELRRRQECSGRGDSWRGRGSWRGPMNDNQRRLPWFGRGGRGGVRGCGGRGGVRGNGGWRGMSRGTYAIRGNRGGRVPGRGSTRRNWNGRRFNRGRGNGQRGQPQTWYKHSERAENTRRMKVTEEGNKLNTILSSNNIVVIGSTCPDYLGVKEVLEKYNRTFLFIDLDSHENGTVLRQVVHERTKVDSAIWVFIKEEYVGGFLELQKESEKLEMQLETHL